MNLIKRGILAIGFLLAGSFVFAQNFNTVNLDDYIYTVLDNAQIRGLCEPLYTVKPYTKAKIEAAINQILEHKDLLRAEEIEYLETYKAEHYTERKVKNNAAHVRISNENSQIPLSFNLDTSFDFNISSGIYNDSKFNSYGFDLLYVLDLNGNISKYLSYRFLGNIDFSYMPLYEVANDYSVGYKWFSNFGDPEHGHTIGKFFDGEVPDTCEPEKRKIKKYLNNSYLPFSYRKPWDGQFYYLSNMSASGLEGWAFELGGSGAVQGDIRASFLDNRFEIGFSRLSHEWAGMDNGASLVLNKASRPFFALDLQAQILPFLKFSSLTGILEYPNQDFIFTGSYFPEEDRDDDAFYWQNSYSLNMLELDFKYVHFDIGGFAVFPKRFEIGYMFPMSFFVEYQNHIGDYDNLGFFGNLRFKLPTVGDFWISGFIDEINGLNNNFFTSTRDMFALQVGSKIILPWFNFGSLSFRYTKIEPYCYTHHSINYTPWYNHYIMENYTNNGESLGYYLPPNSDELFVRIEAKPVAKITTALQYQFIRHGADYGSQQVPGSSLYSELSNKNRDDIKKYFLHDGAYNWIHIISLGVDYNGKILDKQFKLFANMGFMYSYYTNIDDSSYKRDVPGNNGNCANADFSTPFHKVQTSEYPLQYGVVLGFGAYIKL